MPTETGPTRLDPVGLFSRIHEPEQTRGNLLGPGPLRPAARSYPDQSWCLHPTTEVRQPWPAPGEPANLRTTSGTQPALRAI